MTAPATLPVLIKESSAIIVGKITNAKSFFDESGDPVLEYGDIITTEYVRKLNLESLAAEINR